MRKTMKLDKETRDMLSDQEKIKLLTEHEGWAIVRSLFLKKIAQMSNISDINILTNPQMLDLRTEIGVRQAASARLVEILNEVQGTADQFEANSALTQEVNDGYILRGDLLRR